METTLKKIGKYEITGILGRGGMGVVYRAEDKRIGRKVAIKTLTEGFSGQPEMLERFYREAQAGILQHPNIVIVFDLGDEEGLPFIVMEFVDGEPLDKLISSGRQLPLIEKLSIIEQVCLGLGYAHRRGVVHRDIKPANVIVQPDGHAKIVDFGIARVQSSSVEGGLTRTGNVIGTIHYIAPERLKGQPFDGRSDIFATGVMLYLLLTGELPFKGEDMTVLQKLVNEPHPPLKTFLTSYPPELDTIIEKALSKDPEQRYATAEEFAADLHGLAEELKRGQIAELYTDAKRLTGEQQFGRAREVLLQLVRIDPQHTQARHLLDEVSQQMARMKRAEQVRQLIAESEEAIGAARFAEAMNSLDQAIRLDPENADLKTRLAAAKEKKQRYDEISGLMTRADSLGQQGDWTGAANEIEKALRLDQSDTRIRALYLEYNRQAKISAQQGQIRELLGKAKEELSARRYTAAIEVLREVGKIDPSQAEMESLLQTAVSAQEQERRRKLLEQIQTEIENCLIAEEFDRATDLAERAVQQLPNESSLQQLRSRVTLQTRKARERKLILTTVSRAQELFLSSPAEALLLVQKALQELPGEERLLTIEDQLRQRLRAAEIEEVRGRYLREAQDAMGRSQFDRAVEILESYQLEFNDIGGVSELLEMARNELGQQQRRARIASSIAKARSLMSEERFGDAIRLLEPVSAETSDPALLRLLEEARAQQAEAERKAAAFIARVVKMRERGQIDEAIEALQALPAASVSGTQAHALLTEIRNEQSRKLATSKALSAATQAIEQGNFQNAIEALEAVQRAWGESAELTRAIGEIEGRRRQLANEAVTKAIETARGLLAANNAAGALKELKGVSEQAAFADAALQSDWKRLGAEAAKPRKTGNVAQLDLEVGAAPKRSLMLPIVGGGVLLAALVVAGYFILHRKIENGGGSNGGGGSTATTGALTVKSNLEGIKVSVDKPENVVGLTLPDGSLTVPDLTLGQHPVFFSKESYNGCDQAEVTIKAGEKTPVQCTMTLIPGKTPPPVTDASVTIHSMPQAAVIVDGHPAGVVNSNNTFFVHFPDVKPGNHTIKLTLNEYLDRNEEVTLKAGDRLDKTYLLTPVVKTQVTAMLTADQTTIEEGSSVRLQWQTTNANDVSIDNGVGSGLPPQGDKTVTPTKDTTFTITAKGDRGASANWKVAIKVNPVVHKLVAIDSFGPGDAQITEGDSITLRWQTTNATSASIDKVGPVGLSSQAMVTPSATTAYTLTAMGEGGPKTATITVKVEPKTSEVHPPPVDDVKAIQTTVAKFQSLWNTHDVTQLKTVWTGMTSQQERLLTEGFRKDIRSATVTESCAPTPPSGDSVTWSCTETTTLPGVKPQPRGVHFTFVKRNGSWFVSAKN